MKQSLVCGVEGYGPSVNALLPYTKVTSSFGSYTFDGVVNLPAINILP
ncbi:MAG: hypothetical protein LBT81_01315 [Helicobacteraceae bacterium]|jgi:hypothetical protein|nr:hypothetical protein [Helicobacteraceae bacterium]